MGIVILMTTVKLELLKNALTARKSLMDSDHLTGIRLFNGFFEGIPNLTVDLYADTILLVDYIWRNDLQEIPFLDLTEFYTSELPWVKSVFSKRHSHSPKSQYCKFLMGNSLPEKILENDIWYALDLNINQDSSFYLDTRNLRSWITENLPSKRVLNTFAYTGSLGVAAKASGALQVIQTDRNERFLQLAKKSYRLNGYTYQDKEFITKDFFSVIAGFKRENRIFDCIILDPPYFSDSKLGKVDLENNNKGLINKIRPLVAHNGWIIAINNSLFVSGQDYLAILNDLCKDGYLKIEKLINIPDDIIGFPSTKQFMPLLDPSPFNYSTKIAIIRVYRKDSRTV